MALEVALENRAMGRRIAELREQSHLTQPVAAERAGVSLRAYQKWEAGDTRPNWGNLERLAEVFGVKTETIIGESRSVLLTGGTNGSADSALAEQIVSEVKAALLPIERELLAIREQLKRYQAAELSPAALDARLDEFERSLTERVQDVLAGGQS